ncbi:hypothetical protein LJB81_02415 [Desulfovibrio sp. OttesenSCG-928-M14]|nr:hypothetical protein [Desulfovibrio sp. OttesenSCG-928-M14]
MKGEVMRLVSIFILTLSFCLGLQFLCPSQYFDNVAFDYNSNSAAHALLFEERRQGTPNDGNLNLTEHPGVPYHMAMGAARLLSGAGAGETPTERCIAFFHDIEKFWDTQAIFAAVIAAFSAVLLAWYCDKASTIFCLALFFIPVAYLQFLYCYAYEYICINESFAMPVASLFLLTGVAIFTKGKNGTTGIYFVLLGFLGATAYSIKLPYISLLCAGFFAAPLLYGCKDFKRNLRAFFLYVLGIAVFMGIVVLLFSPEMVKIFISRHYTFLTHTGFIGAGEKGIIAGDIFLQNTVKYFLYWMQLYVVLPVFILSLIYLAVTGAWRSLRFQHIGFIVIIIAIHSLGLLKQWGEHYALLLPILFLFLIYETSRPYLTGIVLIPKINKHTVKFVTVILCVATACNIAEPLFTFSKRMAALEEMRQTREEFLAKVDKLPLEKGESIYFQWGTQILPIMGISHPLILVYFKDKYISYNTLRNFFPDSKLQTGITYPIERNKNSIRYMVVGERYYTGERKGKAFVAWDMPHPRLFLEEEDRVVLKWGKLLVVEKAVPIPVTP